MIQRLYVHNYRCLENFELNLKDFQSALLIGKNGTGKSTVSSVLQIFQSIARGINSVKELGQEPLELLRLKDFARGRADVPMRFEIEVLLENQVYAYTLAFDCPEKFKKLKVIEERLTVSDTLVFNRKEAQVTLTRKSKGSNSHEPQFSVDWHLIALPVIQEQSEQDPLHIFRSWLANMIILSPIPSIIKGESSEETFEIIRDGSNFADWFTGLLKVYPAAYSTIDNYLREIFPDIVDIQNKMIGENAKSMVIQFEANKANLKLDFDDLSDGEKCFFLCAMVIAANKYYGPVFCFWDEPDNYLSLPEVGHFIMALRRSFKESGQILATSHNEESIRKFPNENIFVLDRKSHLEPTLIRLLSDLPFEGSLTDALIRGEIEL
jgi:predicted ATPase